MTAPRGKPAQLGEFIRPPRRWEGLYSFNRVWRDLMTQAADEPAVTETEDGRDVYCGADVVALQALGGLTKCHPVYIGTEQITALPPVESDAVEIVRTALLRFPTMYLDFSSARGPARLPIHFADDGTEYQVEMWGALVAESGPVKVAGPHPGRPGWRRDQLAGRCVIPFGTGVAHLTTMQSEEIRHPSTAAGMPTVAGGTMGCTYSTSKGGNGLAQGTVEIEDFGEIPIAFARISYGTGTLLDRTLRECISTPLAPEGADLGMFFGGTGGMIANGLVLGPEGDTVGGGTGGPNRRLVDAEDPERFIDQMALEAMLVYGMTEYVARALYLLSAANVDLVTAPVSRQVRRHAERSGASIASVVHVHRTQVRRYTRPPTGNRREFTHRFERAATYRHVTRGSHFKPDHIRPCSRRDARTGELTCPDGCRLEYVPSHWVGEDHLPMVPKTRTVSIPPPTQETQ